MTRIVHVARAEYLEPSDCDSVIGYKITTRGRLSASMCLSDCNRKIDWYFDTYRGSDPLKKIDKLLSIVTTFRKDFIEAKDKFARRKRSARRKK